MESKNDAQPAKELMLYHEVLLLSFDDKTGRPENNLYPLAISAGVLGELVLADRIRIAPNGDCLVHSIDSSPTGHAILDKCLKVISASDEPKPMIQWLTYEIDAQNLVRLVANELCDMGILEKKDAYVMWTFPIDTYPEADPKSERSIKSRLNSFLFEGDTEADERTAVLACLANAGNLLEPNFGVLKVAKTQERINKLLSTNEFGNRVEDMMAALKRRQDALIQQTLNLATVYAY